MPDDISAGKAVGRVMDVIAGSKDSPGQADAARAAPERVPYSELPERSGKWSRPVRVAIIAGSAAALWAVIFYGIRAI